MHGVFRAPFVVPGLEEDVTGTWITVPVTEGRESPSKEQLAFGRLTAMLEQRFAQQQENDVTMEEMMNAAVKGVA